MFHHPSAQPMKLIPFFRAGQHLDNQGRKVDFTEADLDAAIAGYDPALHRAPLVIGHPKDNGPAFGWVRSIGRNTKGEAAAVPEQLHNDFAEGVAAGTWYPRSASWYGPNDPRNPKPGIYYLRHIGFLGAQPPSIKGLSDIEFDDGEGVLEIEFSDYGHEVGASLWRRMREWLIAQFDKETADQVVPSWEVDSLQEVARRPEVQPGPAFTESTRNPEDTSVTEEEAARLRAENQRLQDQLTQRDKDSRTASQATAHSANVAFAEQMVAQGMKPVHSAAVIAALDFAESSDTPLEFGEGDGRQPLADGLKAIFQELAGGVSFSEQAARERAGKSTTQSTNPLLADAEARATR
ncbi:hypothetical protein FQZ97_677680 [compost metagenome]